MGLRRKPTLVMLAAAALVAVPAAVAALDGTATVRFGNPGAGTVFPPPSGHDMP